LKRQLEDLGYVELEGPEEPRAWLTVEGMDLLNVTENALLAVDPAPRG
jgi:hypothetical protein